MPVAYLHVLLGDPESKRRGWVLSNAAWAAQHTRTLSEHCPRVQGSALSTSRGRAVPRGRRACQGK